MPKLTKRLAEATKSASKDTFIRDSETKGFMLKVTPKGKRVYMFYYRTSEGRERRPAIGEHGKDLTCDQARDIAEDWAAEVKRGNDPSLARQKKRKAPTLAKFAETYDKEHISKLKPNGQKERRRIWKRYLIPALGNTKLSTISKADAIQLHNSLRDTPYMANRVLETLRHALQKADQWGKSEIPENPCSGIERFKEHERERFLNKEEITLLGEVLNQCEMEGSELPNVILALRLLILTGCRRNEILELQWKWIDWENSMIRYPDSKTGKKSIPLNLPAIELLKAANRISGNPYVCTGTGKKGHLVNLQKPWTRIRQRAEIFRLISLIGKHEKWDEEAISSAHLESSSKISATLTYYRAMAEKLEIDIDTEGMETVRLHDLRHSFASVGVASGLSLFMVGKLLTHKDTVTTQRYAHIADNPLREASESIGGQIAGMMAGNTAKVLDIKTKKHTS